jgi:hypothetical protein
MHGGKVRGYFNHWDSYCSGLGQDIIKVYNKYTWQQLKDFFLKKLQFISEETFHKNVPRKYKHRLSPKSSLEYNERAIYNLDWTKPVIWHEDKEEFYKDAILCEYSYIFDLDSKEKKLLIFTGFGKKPSKGYESWYTDSMSGKSDYRGDTISKVYMRARGCLKGEYKDSTWPLLLMEVMTHDDPDLNKALTCPEKMVLAYVNYKGEYERYEDRTGPDGKIIRVKVKGEDTHVTEIMKRIVEYRLKRKSEK